MDLSKERSWGSSVDGCKALCVGLFVGRISLLLSSVASALHWILEIATN